MKDELPTFDLRQAVIAALDATPALTEEKGSILLRLDALFAGVDTLACGDALFTSSANLKHTTVLDLALLHVLCGKAHWDYDDAIELCAVVWQQVASANALLLTWPIAREVYAMAAESVRDAFTASHQTWHRCWPQPDGSILVADTLEQVSEDMEIDDLLVRLGRVGLLN